ncbi:MAG TPA: glycosyltransferase family 2 protein [Candidatus Acidoferrales bacterium]|jgi:dolichol-phosphate mannosyltransferase|nr:glycosyltransferase family 2 protein [Candidatus Acidoferrales bacterium]
MRVSVVIPILNEESVLPELLRRLCAVLDSTAGGPHEIVIVDDGSTDATPDILRRESQRDNRIIGVVLSRNFGHQAALSAGLAHASGEAIIAMDGDLQDPPESIPLFLEKYAQGYDVVYAQRVQRKEVWWLRLCYYAFYRLITALSGIRLPLDAGDFGLMSRRVVNQLLEMPEYHRYLRGMRTWIGFRQIGIPIERAERHAGEPKYSTLKLLKLASDGIFSFSTVPLRFAAILGAVAISLSAVYALYSIYVKLVEGRSPQGFTAIIVAIIFLAGIQLFFMGVIGEYVGRLYEASKGRPVYIVAERIGRGKQLADSK